MNTKILFLFAITSFCLHFAGCQSNSGNEAKVKSTTINLPEDTNKINLKHDEKQSTEPDSSSDNLYQQGFKQDSACYFLFRDEPNDTQFLSLRQEVESQIPEIKKNKYCIGIATHYGFPTDTTFIGMPAISKTFCTKLANLLIKKNPYLENAEDYLILPHMYKYVDFGDFTGVITISGFIECDSWWRTASLVAINDSNISYELQIAVFYEHEESWYTISCINKKKRTLTQYSIGFSFIDIPPEFEDTVTSEYTKIVYKLERDGAKKIHEETKRMKVTDYDGFANLVKRDSRVHTIDLIWKDDL